MSKIKLTTVSGTVIEKPLISCFKGQNGAYVILDNESTGTMGLPIILVCKLFNDKLVKIIDQGEWQSVKENLKTIISGQLIEYQPVATELMADDVYYTQLTLPVNSFDTLKRSYATYENTSSSAVPVSPITPEVQNVNLEQPTSPVTPAAFVAPAIEQVITPVAPVMPDVPTVDPQPIPIVEPQSVAAVNPILSNTPNVKTVIENVEPVKNPDITPNDFKISDADITQLKETFMKSCENMFDALILKFKNK